MTVLRSGSGVTGLRGRECRTCRRECGQPGSGCSRSVTWDADDLGHDLTGRRDVRTTLTPAFGAVNDRGLSRRHIMSAIDASLRRLGTEYVDLYQIHRWDPDTPIEETMQALHDVVRAGKARYIGASSMSAWQFAKAQHVAETNGWTKFASMQNHHTKRFTSCGKSTLAA